MSLLVAAGVLAAAVAASLALARAHRALTIPALLLVGVLLGPHATGVLREGVFLETASDLGLALLLFYTALAARPDVLRRGGRAAAPLAAYDLVLNVAAAYWIGSLFGLDTPTRLLLAGVLATSSTSAILKILGDEGRLQTREGHVLVTLLWIEDLVFIAYYVFLTGHGRLLGGNLALTLAALAGYVAYLVALRIMRQHIWKTTAPEVRIPLITAFGLLGAGLGHLGGLPAAGAAFTTGLVLTGSHGHTLVLRDAPWLRETAAAVFFIGFGAMLDPGVTRNALPLAAAGAAAVIVTELLFIPQAARLLGLATREAHLIGASLVARGGKSASFARLGTQTGSDPAGAATVQSTAGLLTLILTPIAPLLVRALLRFGIPHPTPATRPDRRRDIASRLSRGLLLPTPWRQRRRTPLLTRIEHIQWVLLPVSLCVLATLIPMPWRIAPVALGLITVILAHRAIRAHLRADPAASHQTYANRTANGPRAHRILPTVLLMPIALALLLPIAAPWASLAFPVLAGALFIALLALPHAPGAPRPPRPTTRLIKRPTAGLGWRSRPRATPGRPGGRGQGASPSVTAT